MSVKPLTDQHFKCPMHNRLHGPFGVYNCQNVTLLEITCRGLFILTESTYYQISCYMWFVFCVPVNISSVMSGRVFLGWTSTKQGLICLDQGHNAVPPMRLQPATLQSWVMSHCVPYTSFVKKRRPESAEALTWFPLTLSS